MKRPRNPTGSLPVFGSIIQRKPGVWLARFRIGLTFFPPMEFGSQKECLMYLREQAASREIGLQMGEDSTC